MRQPSETSRDSEFRTAKCCVAEVQDLWKACAYVHPGSEHLSVLDQNIASQVERRFVECFKEAQRSTFRGI
jgi:hypothetical protein